MALDMTLDLYIRPNGLENDEVFWKYDSVRTILAALGIIRKIRSRTSHIVVNNTPLVMTSGIRDDTGALGDALTTKYLGYAVDSCQMGNFTVMIPGLVDVIIYYYTYLFHLRLPLNPKLFKMFLLDSWYLVPESRWLANCDAPHQIQSSCILVLFRFSRKSQFDQRRRNTSAWCDG